MKLTFGDSTVIRSPTKHQVRDALAALDGGPDAFVILDRADGAFIQAHGSPSEGFLLEYHARDGKHHRATNTALALPNVSRAFDLFTAGQENPVAGLATDEVDIASTRRRDTDPQGGVSAEPRNGERRGLPLWVVLLFLAAGPGVLIFATSWAISAELVSRRVAMVGFALILGGLLWGSVRSGAVAGYTRDGQPIGYFYKVIYYLFIFTTFILILLFTH